MGALVPGDVEDKDRVKDYFGEDIFHQFSFSLSALARASPAKSAAAAKQRLKAKSNLVFNFFVSSQN